MLPHTCEIGHVFVVSDLPKISGFCPPGVVDHPRVLLLPVLGPQLCNPGLIVLVTAGGYLKIENVLLSVIF
jgi:hypothetical protein